MISNSSPILAPLGLLQKAPFGTSLLPPWSKTLLPPDQAAAELFLFLQLHYLVPNHVSQNTFSTMFISAKKAKANKNKTNPAGLSCSSAVWHRVCLSGRLSSCGLPLLKSLMLFWQTFLFTTFLYPQFPFLEIEFSHPYHRVVTIFGKSYPEAIASQLFPALLDSLLCSGYKAATVDVTSFLSHVHHFVHSWPWRIKGHPVR